MCRCWVSPARGSKWSSNTLKGRKLSFATATSAPLMLSTLFRRQVRCHQVLCCVRLILHNTRASRRQRFFWPPGWTAEGASATRHSEFSWFVALAPLLLLKHIQNALDWATVCLFIFWRLLCWFVGGHSIRSRHRRHELQQQKQQDKKCRRCRWTSKWNCKPYSMSSDGRRHPVHCQFTSLPWIWSVSPSCYPFVHSITYTPPTPMWLFFLLSVAFLTVTTCTTQTVTLTGGHSDSSRQRWPCLGLLPDIFHWC